MNARWTIKSPEDRPGSAAGAAAKPERIPCLTALSPSALAQIRQVMNVKEHASGAVLARQGGPADQIWVVLEGRLKLLRTGPGGRQQTLRLLGPGECFCLAPTFERLSSPISIQCLTRAKVATLAREQLGGLKESPEHARGVIACIARRLSRAMADVETASQLTSLQRVAVVLLDLSSTQGVDTERGRLIQGISQEELAACAGTVREVAARALSKLERAGALERGRGRILITDTDRLEAILAIPSTGNPT